MSSSCVTRSSTAFAPSGLFRATVPRCTAATAYWRIPTCWVPTANPTDAFHSATTRRSWMRSCGATSIVSSWSSVSRTRPHRRHWRIGSRIRSEISSHDLDLIHAGSLAMLIRRHLVCSHDIPCKSPGGGITKILDELQLPDSRVAREVLQLPPYEWVTLLS